MTQEDKITSGLDKELMQLIDTEMNDDAKVIKSIYEKIFTM